MRTNYQNAVEFVAEWLRKHARGKEIAPFEIEPTELVYAFGLGVEHQFDDHPFCGSKYLISETALEWLCVNSKKDKGAFELLRRIVVTRLLRNDPLPPHISLFAGMVLAGLTKPPPPESQRLAKTFARNLHLVQLARAIPDIFGLPLTRNDASEGSGESACDAVSEALQSFGINKSPRAIKELLVHKSSQRVREIADEIAEIHRHGTEFTAARAAQVKLDPL